MMHRILVVLAVLLLAKPASAFCGFYVAGADAPLYADATQVVLMREGTRTVLSMQIDYKGPPQDFAMVVPVPVVLQKENVKTLAREVFTRVDHLSAPRLVEYWEQDPCQKEGARGEGIGLGNIGTLGHGSGVGTGMGFGSSVTIEAKFEVGEYQILILSAKDAADLDGWLKENGYKIPNGAEPYFKPYIQAGSKFFVAKVDVSKVKIEDGLAHLSPLRFHYDSEKFELPVRLGLVNSAGTQDLIVHVLAPDKRYEVANYPNVTIPTNLDVAESARARFGEFYAALYDRTVEEHPKAVVTEYAWPSSSCDPCPGGSSGLGNDDLYTLGADVLPSTSKNTGAIAPLITAEMPDVRGSLPKEVILRLVRSNLGRARLCYERGLSKNPQLAGKVSVKFTIGQDGAVKTATNSGGDLPDKDTAACIARTVQSMSFPSPEKGDVDVTQSWKLSPTGGATMRGPNLPQFVLTRLHARYAKDSLGADLVFKEAPAIVGGREWRTEGGLEQGSKPSPANSFQARYAIRHAWPGPVDCPEPKRGVWGGRWPNADGGVADFVPPAAATNLAYAPRGKLDLSTILDKSTATIAAAGPRPIDAGDPAPSPAPAKASKCGCDVPGSAGALDLSAIGAFLVGAAALVRRLLCSRSR